MKVNKVFTRIYVNDMDSALHFYEMLLGKKARPRVHYPKMNLELAFVGSLLLVAGTEEELRPFKDIKATFLVDSVDEFAEFLKESGAHIIGRPEHVPTGKNMIARHPDGTLVEYLERRS